MPSKNIQNKLPELDDFEEVNFPETEVPNQTILDSITPEPNNEVKPKTKSFKSLDDIINSLPKVEPDSYIFHIKSPLSGVPKSFSIGHKSVKGFPLMSKEKNSREIRYARNMSSIYVDEQVKTGKEPSDESIIMNDGSLVVDKSETLLLEFLRVHPSYNDTFFEFSESDDLDKEITKSKLVIKANSYIDNFSLFDLKLVYLYQYNKLPAENQNEFKQAAAYASRIAITNPEVIIDIMENPLYTKRLVCEYAIKKGDVGINPNNTALFLMKNGSQKMIKNIQSGQEPSMALFEYFSSNDGISLYEELKEKYSS